MKFSLFKSKSDPKPKKKLKSNKSSIWFKIYCLVLNKKPQATPLAANTTVISTQDTSIQQTITDRQIKEIKTHLLPITLFSKVNQLLFGIIIISVIFLLILLFEHQSLYPLVETQYQYAEFLSEDHNFVNVVHTRHIENEKLIESLLRRYVVEREQIIGKPSKIVEKFSDPAVYDQYFKIIKTISDKNIRSKVRRFIKIMRYQVIESNIRQIEIEFTDLIKKSKGKEAKISKSIWLINIKFDFLDTLRKYNEVAINPAGLIVTVYNIKRQP